MHRLFRATLAVVGLSVCAGGAVGQQNAAPSRVEIAPVHVLSINGKKAFTIGFSLPPTPDAKTPTGTHGFAELRDAGAVFIRTGPMSGFMGRQHPTWDDWLAREREYLDAAARNGLFCVPWLKELSAINPGDDAKEQQLRRVVRALKDHPALGVWKGEDEPQWAKKPVEPLMRARAIVEEEDPSHPVWIVQAPRGTIDELKLYNAAYDIGGVDVYPIGYPPGGHLVKGEQNRRISMVGDYTQKMLRVVDREKPIWFTLQIAWSGVAGPGKTLRFPTFPEQRFMAYQAIINGARGLMYFGGSLPQTLSERDRPHGWNWTYWERVLRPVIEEIGVHSPLANALCAPDSRLPVKAKGNEVEFCIREVGRNVFVLACCRDPEQTAKVTFTGLPADLAEGDVLYESPRTVSAFNGSFTDWFGPFEVHVYRFTRK